MIAILGPAFKQNTDNMRDSLAIMVVKELLNKDAIVSVRNPKAMKNLEKIFGSTVIYWNDEYDSIKNSGAAIILTEWINTGLEPQKMKSLMKGNLIIDARNVLDMIKFIKLGFIYEGTGRRSY